jgi:15-cis-phytoene synthase
MLACSRLITRRYSTSFSLGIRALDKRYHDGIYAVYGFVRLADEIVDTFHGHDKASLLARFSDETFRAIGEGISFNPVLHAFQWAVNAYQIDHELIRAFLRSMEMDLDLSTCDQSSYQEYIYGSAEVVGLMCLKIFLDGNEARYQELKESGRKLGAAFQKVNFLRDLKSDFHDRGRVYFPGADFHTFNAETKRAIEADIADDFREALVGIKQLPLSARGGVYLAYTYYLALFSKIKATQPERIASERIRVADGHKMLLWVVSLARLRLNSL